MATHSPRSGKKGTVPAAEQDNAKQKQLTAPQATTIQTMMDNHPRTVQLRAYAAMANNSNQVAQLRALQQMANQAAGARPAPGANGGVVQCKPSNISGKHSLKLDKTGAIQNAEAARVDPPVSYPMNTLIALNLITHDDLTGGHLFKREYGGLDNYSNVVTWSERSEAAYTLFENSFLEKARDAAVKAGKTVTFTVDTEASFGDSDVTKSGLFPSPVTPTGKPGDTARHKIWQLIKKSLETVPTSVSAKVNGLGEEVKFSRDGSKMLDSKVSPSAVNAQTQVNNIVNNIADVRIDRAIDRLDSA